MPDYKHMSVYQMLKLARDDSGKTYHQLAEATGYTEAALKAFFSGTPRKEGSDYLPSIAKLPTLIKALEQCGSRHIFGWLKAQSEIGENSIKQAECRADVYDVYARMGACFGDMGTILANSKERGIDPYCAREIISASNDLGIYNEQIAAMLDEQASHRDITQVAPLASMKPETKSWRKKVIDYFKGNSNVG